MAEEKQKKDSGKEKNLQEVKSLQEYVEIITLIKQGNLKKFVFRGHDICGVDVESGAYRRLKPQEDKNKGAGMDNRNLV